MTEEDKEKKRILAIPLSDKLAKILEKLTIATSHLEDDDDESNKNKPNH